MCISDSLIYNIASHLNPSVFLSEIIFVSLSKKCNNLKYKVALNWRYLSNLEYRYHNIVVKYISCTCHVLSINLLLLVYNISEEL